MVDNLKEKRSRGGAMFHIIYLALTRKYIWGVLILIGLFIPFVNFLVMVVMFIVGGLNGAEWIAKDDSLTHEQKITYTTFFDRVGYFFFLVFVIIIVIGLLVALLGGGFFAMNEMMDRRGMFNIPQGNYGIPAGGDIDIIPTVEGQ